MKRHFGSRILRLIRGGVVLSNGEHEIAASLVAELPEHLRITVEEQFREYNLVQREVNGRALNFYRVSVFTGKPLQIAAVLPAKRHEAPLIRVSASVLGEAAPLDATLTAVDGRAFSVSFNRPVPKDRDKYDFTVTHVSHAWKSNFPVRGDA